MFERFFGAGESEIKGKTDYDFMDSGLADFFRGHDRKAVEAGKPTSNEEWITFADDGHSALLETIKTPMFDERGELIGVLGIGRDITERRGAEERVKNLLMEKELLLKEVHHRIKNNMNTIKGLLTLQLNAEENPSAASSLRDAESRVQSMIMLYDRLYCTENFRELSVKDYLHSLAEEIVGSFPNSGIVRIQAEIDDFVLNMQTLSPLGIIINELLTNMMKYAFTGKESGLITISVSKRDDRARVIVQDNGIGIPETISFEQTKGFGLDLVGMLVEQMGGDIKIERGEGTRFVLEFDV
jgi:PAS domain S-box-containing protein